MQRSDFASLIVQYGALESEGWAVHRPVLDRTGLTARYDFDLEFAPDESLFGGALGRGADGTRPGLFTAIQEQLGLKLESRKVPVDTIFIEIDRPSEN